MRQPYLPTTLSGWMPVWSIQWISSLDIAAIILALLVTFSLRAIDQRYYRAIPVLGAVTMPIMMSQWFYGSVTYLGAFNAMAILALAVGIIAVWEGMKHHHHKEAYRCQPCYDFLTRTYTRGTEALHAARNKCIAPNIFANSEAHVSKM